MPGYEVIGKEEQQAVNEVFEKGGILVRYGCDEKRQGIFRVEKFEKEFAKKFNVKHALAVSSGTAALRTVLKAFDSLCRAVPSPAAAPAAAAAVLRPGVLKRFRRRAKFSFPSSWRARSA